MKLIFNIKMNGRPDLNYAYGRVVSWFAQNTWSNFEISPPTVVGYSSYGNDSCDSVARFEASTDSAPEDYTLPDGTYLKDGSEIDI